MSDTPPLCAAPDPSPRAPQVTVPDGATDCHFHIFDGPSPQIAERSYTAPPAPLDAFRHLHTTLRISRLVRTAWCNQPSPWQWSALARGSRLGTLSSYNFLDKKVRGPDSVARRLDFVEAALERTRFYRQGGKRVQVGCFRFAWGGVAGSVTRA